MLLMKHAIKLLFNKYSLIPTSKYKFKLNFHIVILLHTIYSSTILYIQAPFSIMSQIRLSSSSPIGRVYMPPQAAPEPEGITPFGPKLKAKFLQYLQTKPPPASPTRVNRRRTNNRSIFSQAKKAIYRRWLQDPHGEVEGESIKARAQDRNARYDPLKHYELN